jgi:hypothetical protein
MIDIPDTSMIGFLMAVLSLLFWDFVCVCVWLECAVIRRNYLGSTNRPDADLSSICPKRHPKMGRGVASHEWWCCVFFFFVSSSRRQKRWVVVPDQGDRTAQEQ